MGALRPGWILPRRQVLDRWGNAGDHHRMAPLSHLSLRLFRAVTCLTALTGLSARSGHTQAPEPRPAFAAAAVDSAAMLQSRSGLMYRDLVVGSGALVTNGRHVAVHYIGQLTNGTEFDASRPGQQPPIRFQVGVRRVIAGWDEGLLGMRVGGRRQLVIPPHLAYGARGVGPIPPNATLVFVIEVVDVN